MLSRNTAKEGVPFCGIVWRFQHQAANSLDNPLAVWLLFYGFALIVHCPFRNVNLKNAPETASANVENRGEILYTFSIYYDAAQAGSV